MVSPQKFLEFFSTLTNIYTITILYRIVNVTRY